jgi:chemotaxis signal transduction protein
MSERLLLFTPAALDPADLETRLTLALPAGLGREAFTPQHLLPLPGGQAGLLGLTEVRGRTVPLVNLAPMLNPVGLTGATDASMPALALLIEVGGEALALTVQQVLGVVTVDGLPHSANICSEPFLAGEYTCRLLNPHALIAAVHTRLAPI